jgi:hypothetical protein
VAREADGPVGIRGRRVKFTVGVTRVVLNIPGDTGVSLKSSAGKGATHVRFVVSGVSVSVEPIRR